MRKVISLACLVPIAILACSPLRADVKLPAIFSDRMVLQCDASVPVWGWAEPGEEVTVAVAGQEAKTKADADGKWSVRLTKLETGGPHVLTVQGKNQLTVNDVLVGEVWLGSGQSNMAMSVNRALNYEQEQAAANLPQLRLFREDSGAADTPQAECKGSWEICTPETVGRFSATAYFFGRELHQALGKPVGLVVSAVGGTPIESWVRASEQRKLSELAGFFTKQDEENGKFDPVEAKARFEKAFARWKEQAAEAKKAGKQPPQAPRDPVALRARKGNTGGLYNGKIAPLVPYAIRGAIWYQGEANSVPGKAEYYQYHLPLLVQDWRAQWGEGDFPFAWVQLPNYSAPGRDWPLVREAMLKTLRLPHTGMAIAIDVGETKDIHPRNKQAVGKRLAMWALGSVYGKPVATSGPLPASHEIRGNEIILSFSHTDGGLVAKDGELTGFEVAGDDKQWHAARARIDGDKVIVSSPDVKQPAAARYAWADDPKCNLYNGAGLPASPFRAGQTE
jgi:sialate O-acetylesterase